MKTYKILIIFFTFFIVSCAKELEVKMDDITPDTTTLTEISKGTFVGNAHPTSGKVSLSKDAAGKLYLVFDNFKTDAGPDLRIYLSEDKTANGATEVSKDVFNGNYKVEVPANTDTAKKTYVLIWCRAFSVLFGNAKLE